MTKLPSIKWKPGAEKQREQLRAWLADWRADQVMAEDEEPAAKVVFSLPPAKRAIRSLQAGAVILLQPTNPSASARPRYIAVIEKNSAGRFLVAPFSRFGVPATPGELCLQSKSLPVRVLCLWNGRCVSSSALPPFWRVGCLTKRQCEDAMTIWYCAASARPVPDELRDRVGPALQHPLDPRHEYLEDEALWMERCVPRAGGIGLGDWSEAAPAEPHSALPLAAERRARYRPRRKPRRKNRE